MAGSERDEMKLDLTGDINSKYSTTMQKVGMRIHVRFKTKWGKKFLSGSRRSKQRVETILRRLRGRLFDSFG